MEVKGTVVAVVSLSARRVWIEILKAFMQTFKELVTLCKESVD